MKFAAFVALAMFAIPAAGQSSAANVGGIVSDQSGARLSDATVTIAHVRNGRLLTMTTGREGEYRAIALIPGEYDMTAARSGFGDVVRRVTLSVGAEATVNFTLAVAGVDVRTAAVAEASLIEAARFQPTSTVTQRQIDTLPVLERNFLVLAQLLPGSGPINSTVNRFAVTKFGGAADQRSAYTTLVDGGDLDDAQWGSPTINVGQDAVQEFKVFRNQFDAQYGHALNAVVTVVTRSGTNRFLGTGFYFGRDDRFNARNAFAHDKPRSDEHRHRFGGTFSGPIVHDRTHFFAAYERDMVSNSRRITLPPGNRLAATENGVFPAESHDGLATLRLDHRVNTTHALSMRYNNEHQQSLRSLVNISSDTSQVDTFNRSHSLVVEDTWTPQQDAANALRVHVLAHTLGTVARNAITAESRPAGSIGQTNRDSQVVPRTKVSVSDTFYIHTSRHELKFGGEFAFATHDFDAHVFEYGLFTFQTDATFDKNVPDTWPSNFQQQKPTVFSYRSQELAGFFHDDWRIGDRFRVNAGVRYDIDLNLRLNDFYDEVLDDPLLAGLDSFISRDRGTDTNNLQPRVGATWDARGDGRLIVRGGSGLYVTRNRPWYQLRSMNQFGSSVVRITDSTLLRNYPDISAVLGGRSLDSFLAAGGPRQLGTVIPDDFVQPYAVNTTAGVGWQLTRTAALDIDYVHSYANHQIGTTDRNLPPSGAVTQANRPSPQFAQVGMLENFTKSWYDALETQFRGHLGTRDSFQVSYTLSRSYMDGVDFFLTTRGTQRTPHERGYNPTDERHNFAMGGSITLPWDLQVGGILKLVSGSPFKVQSGMDLDRDQTATGDLPPGIPVTVGRERVDESLSAINAFRTTLGLAPIARSLLLLDPYQSLDMRLTKTIRLGGNRRIDLLVEGFNLTNHANFRPPLGNQPQDGVSLNTASALVRTVARDPRQIQWGLRYAF